MMPPGRRARSRASDDCEYSPRAGCDSAGGESYPEVGKWVGKYVSREVMRFSVGEDLRISLS